jgi:hypothetical protein
MIISQCRNYEQFAPEIRLRLVIIITPIIEINHKKFFLKNIASR